MQQPGLPQQQQQPRPAQAGPGPVKALPQMLQQHTAPQGSSQTPQQQLQQQQLQLAPKPDRVPEMLWQQPCVLPSTTTHL